MSTSQPSSPQQAVLALASQRPLLRASDVAALNVPTVTLTRLVAAGKLQRVARGLYSLPGQPMHEHRSLAEVALRVPRGVVCLLSALRVHGMGTQAIKLSEVQAVQLVAAQEAAHTAQATLAEAQKRTDGLTALLEQAQAKAESAIAAAAKLAGKLEALEQPKSRPR